MKKLLLFLLAFVPAILLAGNTEPYFGKDIRKTDRAVQRQFKKTFKRPKGVNYDTAARIFVTCTIEADGRLVITDPERVTVEATTYTTIVETEHYNNIHGNTSSAHTAVMGAGQKRQGKSESELLREAVLQWLPTMPAWTPGTVDGQPAAMEVTFNLEF